MNQATARMDRCRGGCRRGDGRSQTVSDEQAMPESGPGLAKATFAGGCFWSMEHVFRRVAGVVSVIVGLHGGLGRAIQLRTGGAGHHRPCRSLQVVYDPKEIDYEKPARRVLAQHDPPDGGGQFCDHGTQYRPVIFYSDDRPEANRRPRRRKRSKTRIGSSGS